MSPTFAKSNVRHVMSGNTKLLRETGRITGVHAPSTANIPVSYRNNVRFGENREPAFLTTQNEPTMLLNHVARIVLLSTEPKMGRIRTRRVIARMAHDHANRNTLAMMNQPRDVRSSNDLPRAGIPNDSVSVLGTPIPSPASVIGMDDLGPESLFSCSTRTRFVSHKTDYTTRQTTSERSA